LFGEEDYKKLTTRRKKSTKANEEKPILLDEKTVREVWDFAVLTESMYGGAGALNPMMLNQRMQDVSLNPFAATQSQLEKALLNPKDSEIQLQGISEYFEIISQPYKRLLGYLNSMLSWDLVYTPKNATKEDYKTSAFKKDSKIVEDFFDRFDYQKEFSIVTKELLRNEAYFGCPRDDGNRIVLQELPSSPNYTKITGRWSHGLVGSFNFQWFLQPGVDISMYPKFFSKKFKEIFYKGDGGNYMPALAPEARGLSSWVYWQDLPVDTAWVWKFSPETVTRLPYFTGLFSDLILQGLMRNLQKNISMSQAAKMLVGSVPMLKDQGAKVANALSMSPEILGKFLALVKSAVSESIKVAAAPLENITAVSYEGDNEMYPTYLKNMLAASGVNTNLIFTSDIKPNQLESQLSLNTDEQLMTSLYPQFNMFLDYHVNKLTKKFKWHFEFEGTQFFTNRAERLERQTTLLQNGIVLPQKISAAVGMRYQDFKRQMEQAKAEGFVDSLTPIVQAAQISGKEEAGRPRSANNKISDSGAQTREDGGNIDKGGKV
jgi:hypothetical protein